MTYPSTHDRNKMRGGIAMGSYRFAGALLGGALAIAAISGASAATLDEVKQRGVLHCGVGPNIPGFAFADDQGMRRGFDVDFCRALAAAVLGDAAKIETTPLGLRDAFAALTTGAQDILTHRLTWTYNRDNGGGMEFVGAFFYDGQGFMVRKSLGVKSATELNGASICIAQGTTTELNVADFFRAHKLDYKIVTFGELEETRNAYEAGRCDAWSNDRSALAARGLGLKNRDDHVILPDVISKEPIGPIVRQGDAQWTHIARWTFLALVAAEELGITSANVDDMKASANPEVKRLLGVGDDLGQKNGLAADWAYQAIKQVGNYGEIFERNVGPKTRLGLARGLNALWKDGGLLYAPPFR
jgi:general L-amino acid transport system substrate-binding protein